MRVFAALAEAGSFTGAAARLGLPKQTVSRRIAELEAGLGVRLVQRTTRRLRLTELGAAYAARCAEVVRLADEATVAITDAAPRVAGTLRVTADPLFGEAFLADLVTEYLAAHPDVSVEVMLTQRKVDLLEEGFDVAFRVGREPDSALVSTKLGPASVRYCASPDYLARRGTPATLDDLDAHDQVALAPEGTPARWLFVVDGAPRWRPVNGRVRVNHLPTAKRVALSGGGVVNLPTFAIREELASGALVSVLDGLVVPFDDVALVYAERQLLAPRVRRFVDLTVARFREGALLAERPPAEGAPRPPGRSPRGAPERRRGSRRG